MTRDKIKMGFGCFPILVRHQFLIIKMGSYIYFLKRKLRDACPLCDGSFYNNNNNNNYYYYLFYFWVEVREMGTVNMLWIYCLGVRRRQRVIL